MSQNKFKIRSKTNFNNRNRKRMIKNIKNLKNKLKIKN